MTKYTVQDIITKLNEYWSEYGCSVIPSHTSEVGAGTLHPATVFGVLGSNNYNVSYLQPSIRPDDGRLGLHLNRMYQHLQYQVILKPSPDNIKELYIKSLDKIGIDTKKHDIRFVHDDWENTSIGAWGLGWEVWCDGMEISQFTYMQQICGIDCFPVPGEITYGLERLLMYINNMDNVYHLMYSNKHSYGKLFRQREYELSVTYQNLCDKEQLIQHFEHYEGMCRKLVNSNLPLSAYDFCLKAIHTFNVLDAHGFISHTDRAGYLKRTRKMAHGACNKFVLLRDEGLNHITTGQDGDVSEGSEEESSKTQGSNNIECQIPPYHKFIQQNIQDGHIVCDEMISLNSDDNDPNFVKKYI